MSEKQILIVDDEAAIREMVRFTLERAGYAVCEAPDTSAARVAIVDRRPDLVLLDWMLPGTSGVELARSLRREEATRTLPIILLTARGEEDDRVTGLESGVDDYITKPFSPRELIARIKAVLRRGAPDAEEGVLTQDGLRLDTAAHRVSSDGRPLEIGPTEFRLLQFFMSHPERVYSRGQLIDRVWGGNVYIEERTVDVHIRRLRQALADGGHDQLIQTVRGAGYRFSAQV